MYSRIVFFFSALALLSVTALADSITVGDKTYDNVYVTKGSSMYYISNPADGTVTNADIAAATNVKILEDPEARKALYDKWLQARGQTPAEPAASEAAAAAAVSSKGAAASAATKKEPVTVSKKKSAAAATPQDYMAEQQRRYFIQRNAAVMAQRRMRESGKYQALTRRQTITAGGGAGMAGGRTGGSSMGGMSGGMGGGMSGGGRGGRR